jgi:exodeoxyribonuclease VII large subunit
MNNIDTKKYISISNFTRVLKNILENDFSEIYLRGEVSNFRPSSSGHWYFSLKDNNANIKAIIFKNSQAPILSLLKDGLKNGQEVLVEGRISVYEKSGEYSIIINKIIPMGIGELAVKFEILKEKMSKEGYFEEDHKKELPMYPETVGIITSPTGAALQDILNVLKRRFSALRIIIFPSSVQGDEAKGEIVQAVKCADYHYTHNTDKKVDVLIVARGGGSIEDLWAFNEEAVAKAIYNAHVPVITGIGHEIDFTISDFCADFRAPTPSAAAEIVVKNSEDLINSISSCKLRMEMVFHNLLEKVKYTFENCNAEVIKSIFERTYQTKLQDYSYSTEKFQNIFKDKLTNLRQTFALLADKLNNLSPLGVLGRGYSIFMDKDRNIIRSYKQVKKDQLYDVVLNEGELEVKVMSLAVKNE